MKRIILSILTAAITPAAFAADYSVFRVCEDKHVIRTSDGAEAGHVEYIVLEPSSRQVVSTIVTGGVIGTRFVAVPFGSMQFSGERDIALTEITRERLVSAPVIERTQITTNTIQPAIIERTYTHFGVQAGATTGRTDVRSQSTTSETTKSNEPTAQTNSQTNVSGSPTPNQNQPGQNTAATPSGTQGEKMPAETSKTSRSQQNAATRQQGKNPPEIAEKVPSKSGEQGKATPTPSPSKSERATERLNRRNEQSNSAREPVTEPGTQPGSKRESQPATQPTAQPGGGAQPTEQPEKQAGRSQQERPDQARSQEQPAKDQNLNEEQGQGASSKSKGKTEKKGKNESDELKR